MNKRTKYIASLDIGSSKICCLLATKNKNDISQIIGLGYNKAKGISNGVISDFNLASESIQSAINEAEKKANIKIENINISASSKIVNTKLLSKKINIIEEKVKDDDIKAILNTLITEPHFKDKQILHAAPVSYNIDGAQGIMNPVGMYGSSLEVEFVISTIGINHYKNYIECVSKCNIDINQIIFSGLASGVAVLNDNELNLGAVVLEIGAKNTSLSIFAKGNLLFSEVVNFGGNNITEAIARYFNISFTEAEKNKIMHASAIEHSSDNEISFEVPSINFDNNEKFVLISKKKLHKIIKPYLEDILQWTKLIISKSGYDKLINKQLIITGGGSQLDGLSILAKNYLDFDTRVGFPREFKINLDNNLDPSHSVALGIIQSILKIKEQEDIKNLSMRVTKKNQFSFFRNWVSEKFF